MFTLQVFNCDKLIAETKGFRNKQAAYEFFMLYYSDSGLLFDVVEEIGDGHEITHLYSV